jgi:pimeloyl-ACP methyl ester carboxylesterase
VVLIHSLGGDCLDWPAEIRRLAGFRVLSLDLPGHGKSDGPARQSIPEYARAVLAFLAEARIGRAAFVGHGMGGALAQILALEHPERVVGLGLISSAARFRLDSTLLEHAANRSTLALAVRSLENALCGPGTAPRLRALTMQKLSAIRPSLLYSDLLACDTFNVTGRLGSIHIPALVVCGTQDSFTPLHLSHYLAAHLPGAALQTIEGAGHLAMLEQPQRVAKILSVFLEAIPYQPGL